MSTEEVERTRASARGSSLPSWHSQSTHDVLRDERGGDVDRISLRSALRGSVVDGRARWSCRKPLRIDRLRSHERRAATGKTLLPSTRSMRSRSTFDTVSPPRCSTRARTRRLLTVSTSSTCRSNGEVRAHERRDVPLQRDEQQAGSLETAPQYHSFEHTTRVVGIDNTEQVVVGLESACARLRDGAVRCWGSNRNGGTRTTDNCGSHEVPDPCRLGPAEVQGLTDVVHLTASMFTYCAVRRDGSVWCWGGRGFPANIEAGDAPTPVRMPGLDDIAWLRPLGLAWLARHEDGHYEALVWGAGPPRVPRDASVPDGGTRTDHLCYVLPDTSMRCQGANHSGQVGNGMSSFPEGVTEPWDPGLCGVRSIVTGGRHTCALLADRRVWCWGDTVNDDNGDLATERCAGVNAVIRCVTHPTLVEGLDDVVEIFAGG